MHCSVLDPEILQSGMKTWPFRNPSTWHIRGPVECVRKETLGRAGGRVGEIERREEEGNRGKGNGREKKILKKAIYNEVIITSLKHFSVHIIHIHYMAQCWFHTSNIYTWHNMWTHTACTTSLSTEWQLALERRDTMATVNRFQTLMKP